MEILVIIGGPVKNKRRTCKSTERSRILKSTLLAQIHGRNLRPEAKSTSSGFGLLGMLLELWMMMTATIRQQRQRHRKHSPAIYPFCWFFFVAAVVVLNIPVKARPRRAATMIDEIIQDVMEVVSYTIQVARLF
jgi:hypothetical protein